MMLIRHILSHGIWSASRSREMKGKVNLNIVCNQMNIAPYRHEGMEVEIQAFLSSAIE